ncbi:MAG TPA: hypothetical protein VFG20_07115 [Planctomycetaceae bacterium]|nr:hypothetical protein [Planctomycetaceae bacterium]
MRRTIPAVIAGVSGTVMILAFFIPPAQKWQQTAEIWFTILAAIAFLIGGTNLCLHHLKKVAHQQAGWGFSAVTLIAFFVTVIVGLLKIGVPAAAKYPDHPWSGSYMDEGGGIWWLYEYVMSPIIATMFSLLAFYVASAAFRAFRAKNVEAMLLLATAFIVLLGRTYAGTALTSWMPESLSALTLPGLTGVIMAVFTTAGQRAIMIGLAVGIAAISLRIILGLDRSYLGSDKD